MLRFAAEESVGNWRPGFYRLDSNLVELNDALQETCRDKRPDFPSSWNSFCSLPRRGANSSLFTFPE